MTSLDSVVPAVARPAVLRRRIIGQTGILLLVLLLYSGGPRSLAVLGTLVAGATALIDPDIGLTIYLATAFSSVFFQAIEGVSASRIVGVTLLLSYLIRSNRYITRRTARAILLLGLMLGWSVFSLTYSLDVAGSFDALSTLSLVLSLSAAIVFGKHADEPDAMRLIAHGMTCMLMFVFLFLIREGYISIGPTISIGVERLTLASYVNPSEFGRSVAQFSVFLVAYLVTGSSRLERVFVGTGYALGLVLLAASGSRSGTISIVACTILAMWLGMGRRRLSRRVVVSTLVLIISLIVLINVLKVTALADRFTTGYIMDTQGARRFILWDLYIREVIPRHFLLGTGIGGASEVAALGEIPDIYRKPSHNMAISLTVELGVVGLLLFGGTLALTVRHGYRMLKVQPIVLPAFSVFVLSLAMGIGEPMLFSKVFWVAFSLIWRVDATTGGCHARA